MPIKNDPTVADNEKVNINRKAIEHRATWMGLMFDEARKAGLDAEALCRRAVKRCGLMHGEGFLAVCDGDSDLQKFADRVFLSDPGKTTFEMEPLEVTADDVKVDFHYCALVSAWKKLGFDDETIALLCDIAMDGDRGIAEGMGFGFTLGGTIAQGCETCEVHFHKKG